MKVKEIGEFGVISLLTEIVTRERKASDNASRHGFKLLVDVGDDTAAWQTSQGTELFTTDTAVEGVHFTKATTPWRDLGWKIMAANVSDIAAMGGLPLYAIVTLGLPPDTDTDDLESLYKGMVELGNSYGTAIVGGDIVRSPIVFVTVGLTGVCEGTPMQRSTAKPGELVAATGYLGSSAGGLAIMLEELATTGEAVEYLKTAHRRPEPCVSQGQTLSRHSVRTAMDISDGLIDDLSKLCQASQVAARINADKIPIHSMLKDAYPQKYLELALGGGEDYQLIFTAPADIMAAALSELPPPACVIGEISEGESGQVTVVDSKADTVLTSSTKGWDHFKTNSGVTEEH